MPRTGYIIHYMCVNVYVVVVVVVEGGGNVFAFFVLLECV